MNRRDFLRTASATLCCRRRCRFPAWAAFPERPIKLIVPFSPGGATDVVGRLWAERMKAKFGTVVTENKGGGGGVIGATEVARSTPNGETLLFGNSSTQVIIPAIADKPPYDPVKDFQAVYMMAISPTCIVVHESVPVQHAQGVHRLRPRQPDQAVLRLGRRRHHDQSLRRAVQGADRREGHHPHSVQRLGAGRDRSRLGPHPDDDAERRRAAVAISRHRQGAHPGDCREQAARGRTRHPDRHRGGIAGHGGREFQRPVRPRRRAEGRHQGAR